VLLGCRTRHHRLPRKRIRWLPLRSRGATIGHGDSGTITDGASPPIPCCRARYRRVRRIRCLVARRMGRPVNDPRGARHGSAGISVVRGGQYRSRRATGFRSAAAHVDGDDRRSDRLGTQRDSSGLPPIPARQCSDLVPDGGDDRLSRISAGGLRSVRGLPGGLSGSRPLENAARRRNRRRCTVRRGLGDAAPRCVLLDRIERRRPVCIDRLSGGGNRDRHTDTLGDCPCNHSLAPVDDSDGDGPDLDSCLRQRLRIPVCPAYIPLGQPSRFGLSGRAGAGGLCCTHISA
jgi:hypothetical protein